MLPTILILTALISAWLLREWRSGALAPRDEPTPHAAVRVVAIAAAERQHRQPAPLPWEAPSRRAA